MKIDCEIGSLNSCHLPSFSSTLTKIGLLIYHHHREIKLILIAEQDRVFLCRYLWLICSTSHSLTLSSVLFVPLVIKVASNTHGGREFIPQTNRSIDLALVEFKPYKWPNFEFLKMSNSLSLDLTINLPEPYQSKLMGLFWSNVCSLRLHTHK